MRFFFPDSQDQVDPSFDMVTEERDLFRVRQRDDEYAHEALGHSPYDGILVSKTVVDGLPGAAGKYTGPQRQRFYREGVRRFFRLDRDPDAPPIATLGDCGAFTYHREPRPPYTPADVADFYATGGFDAGLSVDHVILGYNAQGDADPATLRGWAERQALTLDLADEFLRLCRDGRTQFQPVGVAQGWSPESYARAVRDLQRMGYSRIALGGMVPLRTADVLDVLARVDTDRQSGTSLHLLGLTRLAHLDRFAQHGVASFDSTSPFRQAFMDDKDNYQVLDGAYVALRVPQADGNTKLRAAILAGRIDQRGAFALERECLAALRAYDSGQTDYADALDALVRYEAVHSPSKSYRTSYERTLGDAPWRDCRCPVCREHGVEVAVFRGAERNKRRGFHNLHVFAERLAATGVHRDLAIHRWPVGSTA